MIRSLEDRLRWLGTDYAIEEPANWWQSLPVVVCGWMTARFGPSCAAQDIHLQKDPACPGAEPPRCEPPRAKSAIRAGATRAAWSLSTGPGQRRTWPSARLGAQGRAADRSRPSWSLADHDLYRRPPAQPGRCAVRPGRAGQRRSVPCLCRTGAGADTSARRPACGRQVGGGDGQSRKPQRAGRAEGNPQRESAPAVPAALQPRPQPQRTGARKT